MAFENEFLDLMPHTITINSYDSIDGYGKPSYSTANSTYAALITYENKLIRGLDGTEVLSNASAIIACTGTINAYDKITLDDDTVPVVLGVGALSDDEGQHHMEIFFGINSRSVG